MTNPRVLPAFVSSHDTSRDIKVIASGRLAKVPVWGWGRRRRAAKRRSDQEGGRWFPRARVGIDRHRVKIPVAAYHPPPTQSAIVARVLPAPSTPKLPVVLVKATNISMLLRRPGFTFPLRIRTQRQQDKASYLCSGHPSTRGMTDWSGFHQEFPKEGPSAQSVAPEPF